ncbi:MAG: 50S ribosomal protein L11, partial [Candidatus Omnitrophica bacterium]|nr:50S ribosomal protein L11 [Candidatus Omnitrophota bacterium]
IGPALGQHGVNIMEFCKQFNAKTQDKQGTILPVVLTVYEDKSFSFILKSPPVAVMLKKMAGIAKASGQPNRLKIGKLTVQDVERIAKDKLSDMNTTNIQAAMRIVEGTARSMGIEIVK